MSAYITIDFSRVTEPDAPPRAKPRTDKLTRSRRTVATTDIERSLPDLHEVAPGQGVSLPDELLEAAKATFTATGGNVAEVSRTHNLDAASVTRLAAKHDWPIYGHGTSLVEKARKTRLTTLADVLENKLFQLSDSMGVEKKQVEDITEKGMGSVYVAPLTQRSSAFAAVFDRYMRVMALLEPDIFGHDDDPSNPVAARLRQRANRDALGGVDGIDRKMAEFAGRVAVAAIEASREGSSMPDEVIDAEVVE